MTIVHEKGSELHWKDVRELVVGEYIPLAGDGARLCGDHMVLLGTRTDDVGDWTRACGPWRMQRP